MKAKKDIERKLLEALLNGKKCSQRNFGDRHKTSRLAVFKRRLVERGFDVQTLMIYTQTEDYGLYYL